MVLPTRKTPREKRPDKNREPKPTKPPTAPPVVPVSGSLLSRLTGNVRTHRPGTSTPYNVPFSNVVRYANDYDAAARERGLDALLLAAMGILETGSSHFNADGSVRVRPRDNWDNWPAVGVMQIKPHYHQWRIPNADAYQLRDNIRFAAAIMADGIRQGGSWEWAIRNIYFPGNDAATGTTQDAYIATIRSLMAEMRNQTQPVPVPVPPKPPKPSDPLSVIFGGVPARVEYGFLDDVGLNYYDYGVGHGTNRSTQHTGDDVLVPDETPLYAPADGVVTCVGWKGNPTWGQGCGYFEDTDEGGVGNISILLDAGIKMVLGHSSSALVAVGQRVKAGERVGRSGGMHGPHTHLEIAVNRRGTYWLLDPLPALREAMKGTKPLPPEEVYAERVPVPQPSELTTFAKVIATKSGVPVLQRAHTGASAVRAPLEQGEDFEAAMQLLGDDGNVYWVTSLGSRVPVIGTESEDWPA